MKVTEVKKELSKLSVEGLMVQKKDLSKKLFELKMQVRLGKFRDTALIKKLRKVIARINTYAGIRSKQVPASGILK